MQHRFTYLLAIALVFALSTGVHSAKKDQKIPTCDGPYKGKWLYKDFDEAELQRVVALHKQWLRALKDKEFQSLEAALDDPRHANLCGAKLWIDVKHDGANLTGAELWYANLTGAGLQHANLTHANLRRAILGGATLVGANLTGANLVKANLTAANLGHANLTGANLGFADLTDAGFNFADLTEAKLVGADLTGADLVYANLTDADLRGANLTDAKLMGANLDGVRFEPAVETLPPVISFFGADNLSHMEYKYSPDVLIKLRNMFKEAGWRQQEREITYAIKHTQINKVLRSLTDAPAPKYKIIKPLTDNPALTDRLGAYFSLVFFELTTQ